MLLACPLVAETAAGDDKCMVSLGISRKSSNIQLFVLRQFNLLMFVTKLCCYVTSVTR